MGNNVHSKVSYSDKPAWSHTRSPLKGRPKILNFQLQQLKAPKQNQNIIVSVIIINSQVVRKVIVTN